jgi:rod shape-determining protein MreD
MRWSVLLILAYIVLGLQLGVRGYVEYRGVTPNLPLLLAVFVALSAPRDEALLGCFVIGALQDLLTLQPMGLFAFSYGLMALVIVGLAPLLYRGHPITHLAMGLLGGVVTGIVLLINGWWRPIEPAHKYNDVLYAAVKRSPRELLVQILFTAILAPFVIGIFHRMRWMFDFQSTLRRRR